MAGAAGCACIARPPTRAALRASALLMGLFMRTPFKSRYTFVWPDSAHGNFAALAFQPGR